MKPFAKDFTINWCLMIRIYITFTYVLIRTKYLISCDLNVQTAIKNFIIVLNLLLEMFHKFKLWNIFELHVIKLVFLLLICRKVFHQYKRLNCCDFIAIKYISLFLSYKSFVIFEKKFNRLAIEFYVNTNSSKYYFI